MRKEDVNLSLKPRDGATTYLVALAVALLISAVSSAMPEGNAKIYVSYLASQVAFLSVCAGLLIIKRAPLSAVAPVNGVKPVGLLLAVVVTIGVFMQNTLIATAFSWLLDVMGVQAEVTVPEINGGGDIALVVLVLCVLPALGEELMFRGVILKSLEGAGKLRAIILSGLIFALSHFNPAQLVHQFLLGALLSYITVVTGNIIYACVIHLLNNVIALFIGNIIPAYDALAVMSGTNALIMAGICVVGAMILYPSVYAMVKVAGKAEYRVKGGFKLPLKLEREGRETVTRDYVFIGFMVFLVVMGVLSAVVTMMPEGA